MAEATKDLVLTRPPNCFTIAEYAERHGMDRNKARWTLEKLKNMGRIKRIKRSDSQQVYFQLV